MSAEENVKIMREQCRGQMFDDSRGQEAFFGEIEKADDGVLAGVFSPEGNRVTITQRNRKDGDQTILFGRQHIKTLVHDLGIWLTTTEESFNKWFAEASERMKQREEKAEHFAALQKHMAGYLQGTLEMAMVELEKDIAPEFKAAFAEWREEFSRRVEEFTNTPTTHKN